jgi:hypothetical protein
LRYETGASSTPQVPPIVKMRAGWRSLSAASARGRRAAIDVSPSTPPSTVSASSSGASISTNSRASNRRATARAPEATAESTPYLAIREE